MKKESRLMEAIVLACLVLVAACMIALSMFGKVSQTAALTVCVIAALIAAALIMVKNYKNSNYGGQFHNRYPDAK